MPMLSIIMPYKNAEQWIEETLQSIISQSFTDWELIAIDDHSTDSTRSILEKHSHEDERIKTVSNPGNGIIPALQEGLDRSNGTYITRMDADDMMPAGRLETMVNKIASSKSKTIITGKVHYFSDKEISSGYKKYQNWLNERVEQEDHFKHLYRECVIASPNWIARKQDLIDAMIFDKLEYPEDYSMVFLWFANGFEIASLSEVTLHWREHPKRTSRNSEVYDQKSFFHLKLKWFEQLNLSKATSVGVFGAGKKGKLVIDQLHDKVQLSWYDLNHDQYNTKVSGYDIQTPNKVDDDLLLIAVYPDNPNSVIDFIEKKGYEIGENAWFV